MILQFVTWEEPRGVPRRLRAEEKAVVESLFRVLGS